MNYYKRHWDETTGEELTDSWGTSTYFFEADEDNYVLRQIQIFENGKVLKYSVEFTANEFGALSDQPLDFEELEAIRIDRNEFESTWAMD